MKILAIGDLHGKIPKGLPEKDIDLIILTGDLGKADLMRKMCFENVNRKKGGIEERVWTPLQKKNAFIQAYDSTIKILERLRKTAPIYLVYGNVESGDKKTKELSKEIKIKLPFLGKKLKSMKGILNIGGKKKSNAKFSIAGYSYFVETDWVERFEKNDDESLLSSVKGDLKAKKWFGKLKKVDIILTHNPPYGVLDKVNFPSAPKDWQNKKAGSKYLLNYIKRKQPRYAICGHIHEGAGERMVGKTKVINLGCGNWKVLDL